MTKTLEGILVDLGVICTALGSLISYDDKNEIERLKVKLDAEKASFIALEQVNERTNHLLSESKIDVQGSFTLILQKLSAEMNLTENERLSLYFVGDEKFFILGRYSRNPDHHTIHRKYHDKHQGVLGRARQHGWYEMTMTASISKPEKVAREHNQKCSIPLDVARLFTMKTRSYKAICLRNSSTGHPLAILCAESTIKAGLGHLNQERMQGFVNHIEITIEALAPQAFLLDNAMSEGL